MSLTRLRSRTAGWLIAGVLLTIAAGIAVGQHGNAFRIGQVWGTFAWQTTVATGVTLPSLVTFHADGTVTGVDGTMLGGTPTAVTRTSPFHGVWDRAGFRALAGTSLWIIFDATGGRVGWGRSRSSLEFSQDFQTIEGKMFVETLPCPTPLTCPDPLNTAARWIPSPTMPPAGFPVKGTRVDVVKAGPLL